VRRQARRGQGEGEDVSDNKPPDGKGIDLSGVDAAVERLSRRTYDAAHAQDRFAEALRSAEVCTNVPTWWRAEQRRFSGEEDPPAVVGPFGPN
jgi:hypothetical protein